MAVQYFKNQLYDVYQPTGAADASFSHAKLMNPTKYSGYNFVEGLGGYATPVGAMTTQPNQQAGANGMYADPFGTAMSGTQSGTLQPYINRMSQNASNALYGGLLNYTPQNVVAGDAGGTPVNGQAPTGFNIPSGLLNFNGFGNRSWMQGGGNGTT